jgi:hypothetical protein
MATVSRHRGSAARCWCRYRLKYGERRLASPLYALPDGPNVRGGRSDFKDEEMLFEKVRPLRARHAG